MGVVLNWSSNYPSSKDTISTNYPSLSDGVHDVLASHVNSLANASVEIQKVVGGLRNAPIQDPLSLSANMVLVWNSGSSEWQAENLAASKVTFSPSGGVSSTDVQAAIAELGSDKIDGPSSSTDRAIATYSGTGGDLLRNNPIVITTNGHLDVGGNNVINVGTVDGRNVSVDGTKLDGIEAGATENGNAVELDIAGQFTSVPNAAPTIFDNVIFEDDSDVTNKKYSSLSGFPFVRSIVSSTMRAIPVFNATDGKTIADTSVLIDNSDQLIPHDVYVQGRSRGEEFSPVFSSTLTIDLSVGNKFTVSVMTADTAITFTNGQPGQYFELILQQDGDGTDQTVTAWNAGTGVSAVDKPIGENLTPHTGNNNITSYIGECDDSGSGNVRVRLRKATDSGWETA